LDTPRTITYSRLAGWYETLPGIEHFDGPLLAGQSCIFALFCHTIIESDRVTVSNNSSNRLVTE